MSKKKNSKDIEDFKEQLKNISQKEFDGQTDFNKLSPIQKLRWLDQLIAFKNMASKAKSS